MIKKIALISLRNDFLEKREERRDSIDIAIYKFVLDLGYIPILIPNEPISIKYLIEFTDIKNIGLVLLSGGNDLYFLKNQGANNIYIKRDKVETALINICELNEIPIIGICRGFQFVSTYLGAKIEKVYGHINTVHKINLESLEKYYSVNSFHSFGLKNKNLPSVIEPLGFHESDNTIEMFKTRNPFKSLNIMWHPERINGARNITIAIIKKFLNE